MALLRSVATLGGYTMASRVLGFVREMLTAAFLGAGPISDAFFVALRLPNMFRSLFAEGAFSAAFVPLFAGLIAKEGKPAARIFAEDVLAVLLLALFLFLVLGEAFTPTILELIAPGFSADPQKFALAVELTRIMFPYLLYISLVAFLGGVLNSLDRFAASAVTPVLLNIFLILALTLVRPVNGAVLAWAVTGAGVAQFLWLLVSAHHAGVTLRLPRPRLTPEVRKLLQVMLPGVFGAGVTQINLVVSTAIASLLPTGTISYLSYADRLNQLPLAVIGTAVGTAILPRLSREVRTHDAASARGTQNRGIELALLLSLPASVALVVAARPILTVLFQHGIFGPAQTAATAPALAAYAMGLPAFVLIKVMAPAFYARHDTATPVKIAGLAMLANIALTFALGLFFALAQLGVALALTLSGWINALALLFLAARRGHLVLDHQARRTLPRILLAALGMGGLLWGLGFILDPAGATGLLRRILGLAVLITAGLGGYTALALALGVVDRGVLDGWRRRRR